MTDSGNQRHGAWTSGDPSTSDGPWTSDDAERYLLSRERFGMRFGLDRIRRLLNVLDLPEIPFPTVHIVGTNGKSSTTRMTAALLERHGLRTGCFTSPHLLSYRERIRISERDIEGERFAAQIARTVHAADLVDRSQGDPSDRVTQFELLTAAALAELARELVDVGVLEAGLGGRFDATNVVGSQVVVLTNVGLEHTRYLGPTVAHIAREKLAVVRPGATLIIGPQLHPDALALARQTVAEQAATLVVAADDAAAGVSLRARGAYQRRNFAVACAAARALLGHELDGAAVADAAATVSVPGRFEVREGAPAMILDTAHKMCIRDSVQTICVGIAMSMGALLLSGGAKEKRMALPNAKILIHQVSSSFQGQATDIEIHAREIIDIRRRLDEIIAEHTGKTVDEVKNDTDRDYFMSADEAREYGIIDRVISEH